MTCLSDDGIQAVADGEGAAADVAHVQACAACRARVAEAQGDLGEFRRGMSAIEVPPRGPSTPRGARPSTSLGAGLSTGPRAGATTLRPPVAARRRPVWILAGTAAAAIVFALFVVFPSIDSRTELNASEILDKSLATLAGTGVERLRYQLEIKAPRIAANESGEFVIEQLIDHDSGRWRFARYAVDGSLLNGIAEDPSAKSRDVVVSEGGRRLRLSFDLAPGDEMPLWDLQRRYAEALIRIVQASGARADLITNHLGEQQYVVELPPLEANGMSPLFDLRRARMVIDSQDFHVVEFSAAGTAVGDDVSIGYRLMQRDVWGSVPPDVTFELPQQPGAIALRGEATKHIPHDVFTLLLRAVRP